MKGTLEVIQTETFLWILLLFEIHFFCYERLLLLNQLIQNDKLRLNTDSTTQLKFYLKGTKLRQRGLEVSSGYFHAEICDSLKIGVVLVHPKLLLLFVHKKSLFRGFLVELLEGRGLEIKLDTYISQKENTDWSEKQSTESDNFVVSSRSWVLSFVRTSFNLVKLMQRELKNLFVNLHCLITFWNI